MSCIFCGIAAGDIPAKVVASNEVAVAFLDLSPKEPGHTLVIPRRHVDDLNQDATALVEIAPLVAQVHDQLVAALGAQGANLVVNSGVVAGQEVGHLHLHIVPRYESTELGADTDLDEILSRVTTGG